MIASAVERVHHNRGQVYSQGTSDRARLRRTAGLFEQASIGFFRSTPDGTLLAANAALAYMFGYDSSDELLAVSQDSGYDDSTAPTCWFNNARPGPYDTVTFTCHYTSQDDTSLTTQAYAHIVRDRTSIACYLEGFMEDVGRRQTPIHAPVTVAYIATMNTWRSPLCVSSQISKLLGFSADEWIADPRLWFTQIHLDDSNRIIDELEMSCVIGQTFSAVYRLRARSGQVVWIRDQAVPLLRKVGRPLVMQGIMQDITRHHQRDWHDGEW